MAKFKSIMKKSALIWLIVLSSCGLFPEPQAKPVPDQSTGPISVDFEYRNSMMVGGWVRFIDLSTGIEQYEWSFGFMNNNEPAKSYTSDPRIRFPSNGSYIVELKGASYLQDTLSLQKVITVNNY